MSWHKQHDTLLFEDIEWSKPESRQLAGKVLVIGGNSHSFHVVAEGFEQTKQAGAGEVKAVLPETIYRKLPFTDIHFESAKSSRDGGFVREALPQILGFGSWADAMVFVGDMGRNSETALLVQDVLRKYPGLIVATKDTLDLLHNAAGDTLDRPDTILVASLGQLQSLLAGRVERPITHSMDVITLVETLEHITTESQAALITVHQQKLVAAYDGEVCTTPLTAGDERWQQVAAILATVYSIQHPNARFKALCAAMWHSAKNNS